GASFRLWTSRRGIPRGGGAGGSNGSGDERYRGSRFVIVITGKPSTLRVPGGGRHQRARSGRNASTDGGRFRRSLNHTLPPSGLFCASSQSAHRHSAFGSPDSFVIAEARN